MESQYVDRRRGATLPEKEKRYFARKLYSYSPPRQDMISFYFKLMDKRELMLQAKSTTIITP